MKTAKFWFYWNETKTLIKLQDGQELYLQKYIPWDEGFQRQTIYLMRRQGRLILVEETISRDCDGRYEDYRVFHALIGHCPEPKWQRVQEVYNDYTAQGANY